MRHPKLIMFVHEKPICRHELLPRRIRAPISACGTVLFRYAEPRILIYSVTLFPYFLIRPLGSFGVNCLNCVEVIFVQSLTDNRLGRFLKKS